MAIRKQEFYEGAAVIRLIHDGHLRTVRYDAPFYVCNDQTLVYLKHSTKNRSPWSFTFMPHEIAQFRDRARQHEVVIGLVCGGDGIAALRLDDYLLLTSKYDTSIHVACYRRHGEHYEISGPDGSLPQKVPPSSWTRILAKSL